MLKWDFQEFSCASACVSTRLLFCAFCHQTLHIYLANSFPWNHPAAPIHLSLIFSICAYFRHLRLIGTWARFLPLLLNHSLEIYSVWSQADIWLRSLPWLFWVQWIKFTKGYPQLSCQFYSTSKSVAWTLCIWLIASAQPCEEGLSECTFFFPPYWAYAILFLSMSHATENLICAAIRSSMAFYMSKIASQHLWILGNCIKTSSISTP